MPLLPAPYSPPVFFRNGHLATIYSGLFRTVSGMTWNRERLELPDGDFLDLDWSRSIIPTTRLVVLIHGLEGNARRPYMAGSAKILNENGYDTCGINLRGCSGTPNRLFRSYHSGASEDLAAVMEYVASLSQYRELYIKGFSLGGNLCLKYLGEGRPSPEHLKAAVAVSVPCDLHSSLLALLSPENILYARRFRKNLLAKLWIKEGMFPERISTSEIRRIRNLKDFDDIYTSRAHGFTDAMDYYKKCSCRQFLPAIKIPVLIINARNDSFLGPSCYPEKEARENPQLFLEMPRYGGHVGFYAMQNQYYTEKRTIKFLMELG